MFIFLTTRHQSINSCIVLPVDHFNIIMDDNQVQGILQGNEQLY